MLGLAGAGALEPGRSFPERCGRRCSARGWAQAGRRRRGRRGLRRPRSGRTRWCGQVADADQEHEAEQDDQRADAETGREQEQRAGCARGHRLFVGVRTDDDGSRAGVLNMGLAMMDLLECTRLSALGWTTHRLADVPVPHRPGAGDCDQERSMSIEIRPLRRDERADWEPLWRGYLDFYKTSVPQQTYDTTWARLHDPDEPMWLLGATVDGKLCGIVHYLYHRSCWTVGDYCYLQDLFVAQERAQARPRPRADRGGVPAGAGGRRKPRALAHARDQCDRARALRHAGGPAGLHPVPQGVLTPACAACANLGRCGNNNIGQGGANVGHAAAVAGGSGGGARGHARRSGRRRTGRSGRSASSFRPRRAAVPTSPRG